MSLYPPKKVLPPIRNLEEAKTYFVDQRGVGMVVRAEKGSHGPIAYVLRDQSGHTVYLFHKRDWFHAYSNVFPQEAGMGYGQTFNLSVLKKAAHDGAYLVVVTPTGFFYAIEAVNALEYATKKGTIRTPSTEIGEEASIPASLLWRVEG